MIIPLQEQLSSAESETFKPERHYGPKPKEPKNKDSFGYVLWRILGGENGNLGHAARILKIDRANLGQIIRGKSRVTQKNLKDNKWREILADNFPITWQEYKDTFESYVKTLLGNKPSVTHEPEDEAGFGHLLWRILGGMNIYTAQAAERLGFKNDGDLSSVIHSRAFVSQEYVRKNGWRKAFATYYSKTWLSLQNEFEQHVLTLHKRRGSEPKRPVSTPPTTATPELLVVNDLG